MRLQLDAAQRLFIAPTNIAIESLLMFDIGHRHILAHWRACTFQHILIEGLLLFIKSAVDAINLLAQKHIDISTFFDLLQAFIIGFAKSRKCGHEFIESFRHIAVVAEVRANRLRFHALGFERDCIDIFHFDPVYLKDIILQAARIRRARPVLSDWMASRPSLS
ncbi:hypothetical protein D9M72_586850 [compost metagenome]